MEENVKDNFSKKRRKKIAHIAIGFFIGLALIGSLIIRTLTGNHLNILNSRGSHPTFLFWLTILCYIFLVIYFYFKRKKYIALGLILGIILLVIVPLMIFGGCLGLLYVNN